MKTLNQATDQENLYQYQKKFFQPMNAVFYNEECPIRTNKGYYCYKIRKTLPLLINPKMIITHDICEYAQDFFPYPNNFACMKYIDNN